MEVPIDRKLLLSGVALGALAAMAVWADRQARAAERRHPPRGRFVTVDGVRLHYTDAGDGPAVVLLHGNGAVLQDFAISGLVRELEPGHRVISFDRPGFGYSERPRDRLWTPHAQAVLLARAFDILGIDRPVVVAHSWAGLVALALARLEPRPVAGLALLSGYFYPSMRLDLVNALPAVPGLGDVMRHTLSPLLTRLLWPAIRARLFAPAQATGAFAVFPRGLLLRPAQLRAAAAEIGLMVPAAALMAFGYKEIDVPTVIVAGTDDHVVDFEQSARLARTLPQARLVVVPGAGHMVHHTALHTVVEAVEDVVRRTRPERARALAHAA